MLADALAENFQESRVMFIQVYAVPHEGEENVPVMLNLDQVLYIDYTPEQKPTVYLSNGGVRKLDMDTREVKLTVMERSWEQAQYFRDLHYTVEQSLRKRE